MAGGPLAGSREGKGALLHLTAAESLEVEREYIAHRGAVLAMLRAEFRTQPDHEELYQEAWTEMLELRARGGSIENPRALLKTIAWRRARDRARNFKPDPLDPASHAFGRLTDPGPTPEEETQIRLDVVAIRQVIEELEPRQAAALKLRFEWHLDAKEIQRRLDVSPKRLEKLVTEAYKTIAAQLTHTGGAESPWERRQRSLLLACEMGLASDKQRARAQKMVDEDPRCRALLREMRSTLEQVAILAPAPVLVEERDHYPLGALLDRLDRALEIVRGQLADLAHRLGLHGSTVEQATAGGGARLSGELVARTVAACLAAGGGTAACIESGVLSRPDRAPPPKVANPPTARRLPAARTAPPVRTTRPPSPAGQAPPRPARQLRGPPASRSANAPAAASPTSEGGSEFTPAGATSAARPTPAPAAAPSGGAGEFSP